MALVPGAEATPPTATFVPVNDFFDIVPAPDGSVTGLGYGHLYRITADGAPMTNDSRVLPYGGAVYDGAGRLIVRGYPGLVRLDAATTPVSPAGWASPLFGPDGRLYALNLWASIDADQQVTHLNITPRGLPAFAPDGTLFVRSKGCLDSLGTPPFSAPVRVDCASADGLAFDAAGRALGFRRDAIVAEDVGTLTNTVVALFPSGFSPYQIVSSGNNVFVSGSLSGKFGVVVAPLPGGAFTGFHPTFELGPLADLSLSLKVSPAMAVDVQRQIELRVVNHGARALVPAIVTLSAYALTGVESWSFSLPAMDAGAVFVANVNWDVTTKAGNYSLYARTFAPDLVDASFADNYAATWANVKDEAVANSTTVYIPGVR